MTDSLFFLGAFFLGGLHALDADHVATVSTLILDKQPFRKTFRLAFRWSVGHSLTLFILAGLMLGLQSTYQKLDLAHTESLVGLSMMALGGWVLARQGLGSPKRKGRKAPAAPAGWMLFGMGVLHGVAGSSSILLLIPVALSQSVSMVLLYVFLFSLGMVTAMGLYVLAVNRLLWLEKMAGFLARLRVLAAVAAVVIGFQLFSAGTFG
ncbi:MAG: hypothetical protein GWM98_05775 [Nitrospinaceae bacterium]|nr:hypothetical protein [Nitrospinaceae bacterium]NIR54067.1 hypothetical protein [Nitrospinaceae bacterium]NIT81280.1 hypothetical protein [Nitrospinaceae bacterium]NIW05159.1 hypothetical protein [Nitrospinaceae bacterium]NIX33682.1 hypothetical protein [Nitrospinaceae bacterium]